MITRVTGWVKHNGQQLQTVKSALKKGDTFSIKHVDNVVVNETIVEVKWQDPLYFYVCESCACYSEKDLADL